MHKISRNSSFLFFLFIIFSANINAQVDLQYFLPEGATYNQGIPTPKSVIDHEIGEWHITHDKLVYYFYKLADVSSRVSVEKIGQTYEFRPLLNVVITSEANHKKLEQIRLEHLKLSDPDLSPKVDIQNMPVVIRLGYSVHGNEASGANASLLVAYHLAAVQGPDIDEMLENCIILIDPSLNPDGLQRFSSWVNEHKSKNLNGDPNGREFGEPWPGGRTNHYWFDLNRDWLLAQHPESKARLKLYHEWRPNVQTDHHEMGSNATFFFQPGVPSRKHPLIPSENVTLTDKIGDYHAKALDGYKRLYYSKESFDDFYFGKGSTYPDINGAIGILFEQASTRGHLRETDNGELSFPFAVKNQFITSLSTIQASYDLKDELLDFQKDFYLNSNSRKEAGKALIIGTNDDPTRAILLSQVLLQHQIEVFKSTRDIELNKTKFSAKKSFIIPLNQPQRQFIKAIFERRTTFQDSLFYDVSAWNFDLSFNTNLAWIDNLTSLKIKGEQISSLDLPTGEIIGNGVFAYAMGWNQYYAPGMVNSLMKKGVKVKVASEPFSTGEGNRFERGTILIPIGIQEIDEDAIKELVLKYALKYHVRIHAIASGLSNSGSDLGSNKFKNVTKPNIAMIVGPGASGYETGEVWHLLDQRYDMHITMISSEILDRVKLGKYNVLVMPGGYYSSISATAQERIKSWVQNGGTLIAWRDALRFVSKLQIADLKFKKTARDTSSEIAYADRSKVRGAQVIGGAIFNMKIDNTHPLAYGYYQNELPVFKRGNLALKPAKNTASNPFRYTSSPLLSGYSSDENVKLIQGSPAVSVSSFGEGKVISFVDNPNFRAFWYGTNRLFLNAVFFGDWISTR